VALGRLGGKKGGAARARALSADRRRAIAKRAAEARWGNLPESVRRLLKSYDSDQLSWTNVDDRYAIVREILQRGSEDARRWLAGKLTHQEIRDLIARFRAAGFDEIQRRDLRRDFALGPEDVPVRPFLGFVWGTSP
jgi:putative SOS response-associated peptidase YedK